jgi:cytochrome c biogenesis protein
VRLTLWLLLALALTGALGTGKLIPQSLAPFAYEELYGPAGKLIPALGLDSFYTSLPYRALFVLLILNLLACAVGRSIEGVKNAFAAGNPAARVPLTDRARTTERLRAAGYTIKSEAPLLATKRSWVFFGFPLVHLAPLFIVAGAFWGSVGGSISTQNIHVGSITESVFEWGTNKQLELPFAIGLTDFHLHYHYPLKLRVKALVQDDADGPVITTKEGEEFAIPGTDYSAVVESFDNVEDNMYYTIKSGDTRWGPFSKGMEEGAPLTLRPEAFKGEVKQGEAIVTFFGADRAELFSTVIAVNSPATLMGYSVYLTAWGDDSEGLPFAGFQITRDPGQVPLWIGAVFLSLGIFVILFCQGAWVREEEGVLVGRASRERRLFATQLSEFAALVEPTEPAALVEPAEPVERTVPGGRGQ